MNSYCSWAEELAQLGPEELAWWSAVRHADEARLAELGIDTKDIEWMAPDISIWRDNVWLGSGEVLGLETLVALFQAFLRKFRPTEFITVRWIYACDELIPGEFGGGIIVISAWGYCVADINDLQPKLIEKLEGMK